MKDSKPKLRATYLALLPLVFLLTAPARSEAGPTSSQADAFLSRLTGTWQGEGKAFGMLARLHMKWEWVLGNKFLRLSLRNEMRSANGQIQIFEGHAYYQPAGAGKYEAKWFDSRGISFPIKAHTEGDGLIVLWGSPEQEQGKSVYRIIDPGKVEVVDSSLQKDGTFKEFGRFVLVRD